MKRFLLFWVVWYFSVFTFAQEIPQFSSVVCIESTSYVNEINYQGSTRIKLVNIGTGVLVSKKLSEDGKFNSGYLLTAYHVVEGSSSLRCFFMGGKQSKCEIVKLDKESDLAVLKTVVPDEVFPVEIADSINRGDKVITVGYKNQTLTYRELTYLRDFKGNSFFDGFLLPGESGGPMFKDGKLVSINSGGWFWTELDGSKATWPSRGASLSSIKEIMKDI